MKTNKLTNPSTLTSAPHLLTKSLGSRIVATVCLLFLCTRAWAITYTVNSTADPGDGICDAVECTLREAIIAANANPGLDVIEFSIGGGGPQTIQPLSALPGITDPLAIDGTTQPGFLGAPLIEIDGNVVGGTGLRISAGASTIVALYLHQFPESGISLESGDGNHIANVHASWDGLTPTGAGVTLVNSSGNVLEQVTATGRARGIQLGADAGANTLQNNWLAGNGYGIDALSNTGQANRYLDNDLSGCSAHSLRIYYDLLFEVVGNNFDGSAGGLLLVNMDGINFAPAPGTVDLRRTTGQALTLVGVTNSRVAGLDLSWIGGGGGQSGVGFFAGECANLTIENVTAHERVTGVYLLLTSDSSLTEINSSASGSGFVGEGIVLGGSSRNTVELVTATGRVRGIQLGADAGANTLQNNRLAGNLYGIDALSNTGQANRYLDNDLSGCSAHSLRIYYDLLFEVAGNNFDGSAGGLLLVDMDGINFAPAPGTVDLRRTTGQALTLVGVTNSRVAGLDLSWTGGGQSGSGLFLSQCANVTIENIATQERVTGVYLHLTSDSSLTEINSSASGSGFVGEGIVLGGSSRNTVELVTATGRVRGIQLGADAGANTLQNNRLAGNLYGIDALSNTGQANRYLDNDLSGCSAFSLRIYYDLLFEVAGNNFDDSAGGLLLVDMDGINFAPAPGTVDLRRTTGQALTLVGVTNSRVAGLDLSWTGGGQSGSGLFLSQCANVTIENIATQERVTGVYLLLTSDSSLTEINSSASGSGFVGEGIVLGSSSRNTVELVTATGRVRGIQLGADAGANTLQNNWLAGNLYGIDALSNTGQANRYLDNDLSGCSAFSLRIYYDLLFEVAGNNFDDSAGGLLLVNMDGINFAPAPGTVDLRRTTGQALSLVGVTNSRVAGLDLSWTGGGQSGSGLYLSQCANVTIENITAQERGTGVQLLLTSDSSLTEINSSASGSGFVGQGIILQSSSRNTVEQVTATGRAQGIQLWGDSQRNLVQCSSLQGNNYGILDQSLGTGNEAHENYIAENVVAGVQNHNASSPLNAVNNFWGTSDGPAPIGSGNPIVGDVDAEPFLTSLPPCLGGADLDSPVITCPPSTVVPSYDVPTAATNAAEFIAQGGTIMDDHDPNPSVSSLDSITGYCPMQITRTYTVTDASGNPAMCDQLITVENLFAEDSIIWHQPLARNGASEDSDPSADGTLKYRFKLGSTIPIQIHVHGCDGTDITGNANVIGTVEVFGDTNCGGVADGNVLEIDYNGVGEAGGVMDKVDGHLKFNLDTKKLPQSTECYILQVTVTDSSTGESYSETVPLQAR